MKLIAGTTDFHIEGKTAVAIGKFDGIHRGHQKLINEALRYKKQGLKTIVFTFDPSPGVFFRNDKSKELTTKFEKRDMFMEMGIDILIEYPLNTETAAIKPELYIEEILVKKLHAAVIVAGIDISFGHKGRGDMKMLQSKAVEFGYQVRIIDKVCINEKEISSTYVREEVQAGNMENVTRLLGSPYCISGKVAHGKRLGRTFGMPTVNQIPAGNKLLPPFGVYFSKVLYENKEYDSLTNIGIKPTVTDENIAGVETYIYDFSEDLYGKRIDVKLLKFSRGEIRFDDISELIKQLQKDMEQGRKFHNI
ncbi:MAG TPA: bifunctional riboflavin kinase/FAD synthetase [Lachnospiraceae bacterium]|nr:bifunctional riboflavin kinase/FAD synthetase [Lachnospiraceae bacterium]